MADENRTVKNEQDSEVDNIKIQYSNYMREYYSKNTINGPWTREWIKEIKNVVSLPNEESLTTHIKPEYLEQLDTNKFVVDDKNEGGRLRRVLVYGDLTIKRVAVPWEDAFSIIWEMHTECNHGSVTETMERIKSTCYMDVHCVHCVIKFCHICTERNKNADTAVQPVFNQRAMLEVLDLSSKPDGKYKYVLIYTDEGTGLVQLRALTECSNLEITLRLMNIFGDLGIPKIITIFDPYEYEYVFEMLRVMFKPCEINYEIGIPYNSKMEHVKNLLMGWTKRENTNHWQIGCYSVQWEMNNKCTDGRVPQHLVFGPNRTENPTMVSQCNVFSGPSNEMEILMYSTEPQVMLFDDPVTEAPDPQPTNTNSDVTYGNILHQALAHPEEKNKKNEVDSVFQGKQIKSYKAPNILRKSYVKKKVMMSNQNVINQDQPGSSKQNVNMEPTTEGALLLPNINVLQNFNIDVNNSLPITVEYPKVPLKLEIINDCSICSVCQRDILNNSCTCTKCLTEIHFECGEIIAGVTTKYQIICFSCDKEVKRKKFE